MSDSPHHEAAADSSLLAQQQHNSTGADDASSTTSAAETPTAAVKVQKPKAAAPAAAHNNGGVVVTLADLGLDNLGDDKTIRALLDPSSNAVNPLSGFDWSEAKLERLVEVLKPEHLAVLIKKRSQTQLEESAKTLSWHHLTYTTASGVKLLDDVSGYILPVSQRDNNSSSCCCCHISTVCSAATSSINTFVCGRCMQSLTHPSCCCYCYCFCSPSGHVGWSSWRP